MRTAMTMWVVLLVATLVLAGCKKDQATRKPAEGQPPAEQAEPVPTPEAEPIPEPVPELEAKPAPEPAPTPSESKVKTPWADAKVGTMVKMRQMGGIISAMEVTKVDEDTVTVRTTMIVADMEPTVSEMTVPRYAPAPAAKAGEPTMGKSAGTETITVAGQELQCEVWESRVKMGEKTITTRTYICKEVPGWIVRTDSNVTGEMQAISEVIEFNK